MIALAIAQQQQRRLAGIEQVWGKDPCAASPVQTPDGPRPSTFGINFDKGSPIDRDKSGYEDIFECLPRKIDCPGADEVAVGYRGQYGCMKMADIEAGKSFCDAYPSQAVCTPPGLSTPAKVGIGVALAAGVFYLATRLPMIALLIAQQQQPPPPSNKLDADTGKSDFERWSPTVVLLSLVAAVGLGGAIWMYREDESDRSRQTFNDFELSLLGKSRSDLREIKKDLEGDLRHYSNPRERSANASRIYFLKKQLAAVDAELARMARA